MQAEKRIETLTRAEAFRVAIARREMLARKRRELEANPNVQKWRRMTREEKAKSVIELMTKNHMEHAKMLGKFGDEDALRARLANLAVAVDSLERPEL